MQGTQYATKRSILCRGAFCGPTKLVSVAEETCFVRNLENRFSCVEVYSFSSVCSYIENNQASIYI